jgi:hypothetical protein
MTILTAGIAPAPVFSYKSLVIDGYTSWTTGRMAVESDFAVGINGQPLAANSWVRYEIVKNANWALRAGVCGTLLFADENAGKGQKGLRTHRMGTMEGSIARKFSERVSLTVSYQLMKAFDKGAFNGTFISMAVPMQAIKMAENLSLLLRPQFYYFNFKGGINGIYSSATIGLELKKCH